MDKKVHNYGTVLGFLINVQIVRFIVEQSPNFVGSVRLYFEKHGSARLYFEERVPGSVRFGSTLF